MLCVAWGISSRPRRGGPADRFGARNAGGVPLCAAKRGGRPLVLYKLAGFPRQRPCRVEHFFFVQKKYNFRVLFDPLFWPRAPPWKGRLTSPFKRLKSWARRVPHFCRVKSQISPENSGSSGSRKTHRKDFFPSSFRKIFKKIKKILSITNLKTNLAERHLPVTRCFAHLLLGPWCTVNSAVPRSPSE